MLSPAVPPFGAPKVEEKKPHSTKSCHTKTDLQTRRAPEKKQIQGRQGSQPSAARKTEKNSRNRQQGRNSSWKLFSGSSFFLGEERASPSTPPCTVRFSMERPRSNFSFFPQPALLHDWQPPSSIGPFIHLCENASRTSWPRKNKSGFI